LRIHPDRRLEALSTPQRGDGERGSVIAGQGWRRLWMEVSMRQSWHSRLLRNGLCVVAVTAAAGILLVSPPKGQGLAQGEVPPGLETSVQQQAFRRVADEFVAAAAAGDRGKVARMLSPAIAAKTGPEGVERFLTGEVLPFFGQFKETARSTTITRTADVTGFVFYLYMVSRTGEFRPFVIYVIEEGGAMVVANVLVDRFVEGRHCAKVSSGWQCPDFSG
jgi:hypothetical protein